MNNSLRSDTHAKDLAIISRKAREYATLKGWSAGQLESNLNKLKAMSHEQLRDFADGVVVNKVRVKDGFLRRLRCLKNTGYEEWIG